MACHQCSFTPTIEGFEQEPNNPAGFGSVSNFSVAEFNEPIDAKDKNYQCQSQQKQTCVYTAQGQMVCNMKGMKPVVGGFGFFDRSS